MKLKRTLSILLALGANSHAVLISAPPGPDDQGGMIMPMVTITATSGTGSNPTAGTVNVSFSPTSVTLKSTQQWVPGSWYADTAAWRADLGSPAGVGGTPVANAGSGSLFNNRYGFMFMSMGSMMMANVPTGNSLAIRLDAISSASLQSFNYGNASNRWDEVFDGVDSHVLWNGTMWHNYFTMPSDTPAGSYSATFEIFVADTPFTGSTGFAQYDAAALGSSRNTNFDSAFVTYNFDVVPEPSVGILLGAGIGALLIRRKRR